MMQQRHAPIIKRTPYVAPIITIMFLYFLAGGALMGCGQSEPAMDTEAPESTAESRVPEVTMEEDTAPVEAPAPDETEPQAEGAEEDLDVSALPPITSMPPEALTAQLEEAREAEQVVVINFWATWCPPCLAEMPYFVRFYEEYDPEQVRFISITADHIDTLDSAIRPYQAQENLPFPIYILEGMDPTPYAEVLDFRLTGRLPVTLIYDRDGALAQSWEREIGYEELEEAVEPLI